jgi:hypothetical protein
MRERASERQLPLGAGEGSPQRPQARGPTFRAASRSPGPRKLGYCGPMQRASLRRVGRVWAVIAAIGGVSGCGDDLPADTTFGTSSGGPTEADTTPTTTVDTDASATTTQPGPTSDTTRRPDQRRPDHRDRDQRSHHRRGRHQHHHRHRPRRKPAPCGPQRPLHRQGPPGPDPRRRRWRAEERLRPRRRPPGRDRLRPDHRQRFQPDHAAERLLQLPAAPRPVGRRQLQLQDLRRQDGFASTIVKVST